MAEEYWTDPMSLRSVEKVRDSHWVRDRKKKAEKRAQARGATAAGSEVRLGGGPRPFNASACRD